jgi:hypothetical protein
MAELTTADGTVPSWTAYATPDPDNSPGIGLIGNRTIDFYDLLGTFLIEWDTYGSGSGDASPDHSTITFVQSKTEDNGSVSTLLTGSYAPGDASSRSLSSVFTSGVPACTSQCILEITTAGTVAGGPQVEFAPVNFPPATPTSNWPCYTKMLNRNAATSEIFVTQLL